MTAGPEVPQSHLHILQEEAHGVMSTIRHTDGLISTNPVAFDWDGKHVRISTLKQRIKYDNLLADPRITFCVISSKDLTRYIEIRGRAELSDDINSEFQLAMWRRMTGQTEFNLDPPGAERVIIKIIAEQVSAPMLYGGRLSQS